MGSNGRKWTAEEKLQILDEARKAGQPVSDVCRRHQIAPTQFYEWEKQARAGALEALRCVREAAALGHRSTHRGRQRFLRARRVGPTRHGARDLLPMAGTCRARPLGGHRPAACSAERLADAEGTCSGVRLRSRTSIDGVQAPDLGHGGSRHRWYYLVDILDGYSR